MTGSAEGQTDEGAGGGCFYIAPQLRPLAVDVSCLTFDPANARKHNQRNLDSIKASLSKFGQRTPIVVQRKGLVVRAGNGRLKAAIELGWEKIAAVIVDDDNVDAVSFGIADNRTAELAEWDVDALRSLLDTLDEDDLQVTGFTEQELESLVGQIANEEPDLQEKDVGPLAYKLVVTCKDEREQAELMQRLEEEGYACQFLMS